MGQTVWAIGIAGVLGVSYFGDATKDSLNSVV